jgi:hypothetical protein
MRLLGTFAASKLTDGKGAGKDSLQIFHPEQFQMRMNANEKALTRRSSCH